MDNFINMMVSNCPGDHLIITIIIVSLISLAGFSQPFAAQNDKFGTVKNSYVVAV